MKFKDLLVMDFTSAKIRIIFRKQLAITARTGQLSRDVWQFLSDLFDKWAPDTGLELGLEVHECLFD